MGDVDQTDQKNRAEAADGGKRLHAAIGAALETAAQAGQLRGSARKELEATLAKLDEKLGAESGGVQYKVESAPDQCLVIVHSSDPVAFDVISSFMHHAGAKKLGSAKAWQLPLAGIGVNRWVRGLRRVIAAEHKARDDKTRALPVRLTVVSARHDELEIATLG